MGAVEPGHVAAEPGHIQHLATRRHDPPEDEGRFGAVVSCHLQLVQPSLGQFHLDHAVLHILRRQGRDGGGGALGGIERVDRGDHLLQIGQRDLFALVGRHCLRKFLAAQEDRSPLEGDGPKLYGRPTGLQGRQRTARRGDDPRLLRARRRPLPIHALLLATHLEIHAAGSGRDLRSNERRAKDDAEREHKDPTCGPGKAHGGAV